MRQANSLRINYTSWFAVPRGIMRKDAESPRTMFDRFAPPEMRLYLHLQKLRRPNEASVEIRNVDLMRLVGLYREEFYRARASLVEFELLTHEAIDGRGQTHRYRFTEHSTHAPDPGDLYAVPVPCEVMDAVLNPPARLAGKATTAQCAAK